MPEKKDSAPSKKSTLDLRFTLSNEPSDPDAKRFHFFLIDTGWNDVVSDAVFSHLKPLISMQSEDRFYVLTRQQSFELMRRAPHLIGHDPIILVYDLHAPPGRKTRGYRGFRLNLGKIKQPKQALVRLQEFLRFVAINRNAVRLEAAVRRELYREGFDGLVKILRDTSTEFI